MEGSKTLMITLPKAQYQELERMSERLRTSKSKLIQQALMMLIDAIGEPAGGVRNALD